MLEYLTQAITGRDGCLNLDGPKPVEVIQRLWRYAFLDGQKVGHLHHGSIFGTQIDVADIGRGSSSMFVHLDNDVVLFSAILVTGHLAATEHGFQRSSQDTPINADISQLVTINLNAHDGCIKP